MKKIAIIGKGTAGALSALVALERCLHPEKEKCTLDWYFDSAISTQAVGEGTTLAIPSILSTSINFNHYDLYKIDGSFKYGISKRDWSSGVNFTHTFRPPYVAYHFNALRLQDHIISTLKNIDCINVIDKNVSAKEIDADLVIDCSGNPESYDDFYLSDYIPVNSVYVTQCWWDYARFQTSITDAAKYGWVFGIPLQNRCSIGYLYNNKITTLEEVKEDVKNVFERYNLTPSDKTNAFSFKNYYRKTNFSKNIVYNGNASFFLEPIEATSTSMIVRVARSAITCLDKNFDPLTLQIVNTDYQSRIEEITNMIMLHYAAGSIYDNEFWSYAQERSERCIKYYYKNHQKFRDILKYCIRVINTYDITNKPWFNYYEAPITDKEKQLKILREMTNVDYGTWDRGSWIQNLIGLNITNHIKDILTLDDFGEMKIK